MRKNCRPRFTPATASDVIDAVALGADSIEHGSFRDEIPDATIAEMEAKGIAFDPTLSVVEGFTDFSKGKTDLLKRSLVQQVATKELLTGTEHAAVERRNEIVSRGAWPLPACRWISATAICSRHGVLASCS